MEFVHVQHSKDKADLKAYAVLRTFRSDDLSVGPILPWWAAARFDCSTAYRPALDAVKAGKVDEATKIITDAGIYEDKTPPPDSCFGGNHVDSDF